MRFELPAENVTFVCIHHRQGDYKAKLRRNGKKFVSKNYFKTSIDIMMQKYKVWSSFKALIVKLYYIILASNFSGLERQQSQCDYENIQF